MKNKTHSNGLTLEQQERIYLLIDSLSSSIEHCSKILVNGYKEPNNRLLLHDSLARVNYSLGLLLASGDVSAQEINSLLETSKEYFLQENMIHYQPGHTDEI